MRTLPFALAALLSTGCIPESTPSPDAGPARDAGPTGPVSVTLDQAVANIVIAHSSDDLTATVTATLTTATGVPVLLHGQQYVAVGPSGGTLTMLGQAGTTANPIYTGMIASSHKYDIKVDEPTKGIPTTTITAPGAVSITSPAPNATASLSGFTLDWAPVESTSVASLLLSQSGASPAQTPKKLTNDPGTYAFTITDLAAFAQGSAMTVTVTVSSTTQGAVEPFATSTVQVQRGAAETVNPGP